LLGSGTPRITKTTHTRHYRYSKKNPKNFRQVTIYDLGNVEQQTRISFKKEKLEKNDLEVKKELNPELLAIRLGDMKLAYYFKDNKGFIYDSSGFFSGRFDGYDLKRVYNEIGNFFKAEKTPFSRNILRSREKDGKFKK
jgi:hypothetical protein